MIVRVSAFFNHRDSRAVTAWEQTRGAPCLHLVLQPRPAREHQPRHHTNVSAAASNTQALLLCPCLEAGLPAMEGRLLAMIRPCGLNLGPYLCASLHLNRLTHPRSAPAAAAHSGGWQLRPNQQGVPAGSGARPELPGETFHACSRTPTCQPQKYSESRNCCQVNFSRRPYRRAAAG